MKINKLESKGKSKEDKRELKRQKEFEEEIA